MTDSYHIAIDEDEVQSSLFRGGDGFASYADAAAHLSTYDDDYRQHFRIFRANIQPVSAAMHLPVPDDLEAWAEDMGAPATDDEPDPLVAIRHAAIEMVSLAKTEGQKTDLYAHAMTVMDHAEALAAELEASEARAKRLQSAPRAVIFAEGVHDALAVMREKLLDPDLAHTIAGEMFMHGYEGDLAEATTVPPIAIGAVIGHLFGECHTCAEHEVRRALANAEQPDEPVE